MSKVWFLAGVALFIMNAVYAFGLALKGDARFVVNAVMLLLLGWSLDRQLERRPND